MEAREMRDAPTSSIRHWIFKFSRPDLQPQAELLYHGVRQQCMLPEFQNEMHISRTFSGVMMLMTMHSWVLKMRIAQEGKEGLRLLKMYNTVVLHKTQEDLKAHGVVSFLIDKRSRQAWESMVAAQVAMDECLRLKQAGKGLEPVCGALWRNLYFKDERLDLALLPIMWSYLERELASVMETSVEDLVKRKWGPPPKAKIGPDSWRPDISAHKTSILQNMKF